MKVSTTGLSREQIITNVNASIEILAKNIPGGAINIKSLHLKSVDSPALPIYVSFGEWAAIIAYDQVTIIHWNSTDCYYTHF